MTTTRARSGPPEAGAGSGAVAGANETAARELAQARAVSDRIAAWRSPLERALEAELRSSPAGQRLLARCRTAKRILDRDLAAARLRGSAAWPQAAERLRRQQAALIRAHAAPLATLKAGHAALDVPLAEWAALLAPNTGGRWAIEGDAHGASWFGTARPNERPKGETGEEPVPAPVPAPGPAPAPGPVPLDLRRAAPYDLPEQVSIWSTGITGDKPAALASPANGSCVVQASGVAAVASGGGSVARALVGTAFEVPAGFTRATLSADISIDGTLYAFSFLPGVAGAGFDYWLRIEADDGTPVVERNLVASQVLAPVLWYADWSGEVRAIIAATVSLDAGTARTLRVWAGANGHAEAGGMDGYAHARAVAQVRSIRCVAS